MIRWIFLLLIKAYQGMLSPLLGRNCRFTPTCSNYTAEAIHTHGSWKGIILGIKRISKCHPWGSSGYDPVPPKHKNKKSD